MGHRRGARSVESKGIFPNAQVVRGHDWSWGQQDGQHTQYIYTLTCTCIHVHVPVQCTCIYMYISLGVLSPPLFTRACAIKKNRSGSRDYMYLYMKWILYFV